MTTCPVCRLVVAFDTHGNSACGHVRAGIVQPPPVQPPPVQPQPAPPPLSTSAAAPLPPPGPQGAPGWGSPVRPAPRSAGGIGRKGWIATAALLGGLLLVLVLVGSSLEPDGAVPGGAAATTAPGSTAVGTPPPAADPVVGSVSVGETAYVGGERSDPGQDTTLSAPADGPGAGIRIHIPGDAYGDPVDFELSVSSVEVDGYAGLIEPASGLVTIENGGRYAGIPIAVTVPAEVPDGWFAMGFYLLPDGSLEPMPLVEVSPTSVTVATRHFSSFFIGRIREIELPESVGTGFHPGVDDFPTPNYGSALEPNGHCAGQSLAEMWYFAEQKPDGAPALWSRYDGISDVPTPSFWRDDRLVYRLASSVQHDIDWDSDAVTSYWTLMKSDRDDIQRDAFRYAMAVTGMPQFVGLTESGRTGGHAIVAYAVTPHGLWVADPNFPGALREIEWDAQHNEFVPYLSGATAAKSDHAYNRPAFFGKTAFVPWEKVGDRFAEANVGTIGNGAYPAGTLLIGTSNAKGKTKWEAFTDGMTLPGQEVLLKYLPDDPADTMNATLYNGEGRVIANIRSGKARTVTLGYGINDLGVFITAEVNGNFEAVDFTSLTVRTPPPGDLPVATDPPVPADPVATDPPQATPAPPSGGYDCSKPRPTGIKGLDWDLHCTGISP